jgi:glyoxylase I family protein
MRGGIDHIVLTVREPQASFALYDALLRFLGYELVNRGDAAVEWTLESEAGSPSVCLVKARDGGTARQHDRYSPGLHHLAWAADSREDVDRLHADRVPWRGVAGDLSPRSPGLVREGHAAARGKLTTGSSPS